MLHQLEVEGLKVRNEHIRVVGDACNKYWEKRGKPIAEEMVKLIDFPKKKKASKKKNKQHQKDEN